MDSAAASAQTVSPRIIAISRIKDSILTASEFLYRLSQLVDGVVIVDNGSTDGTEQVYQYFSDFVLDIRHTEGFDEGRDRQLCLEAARAFNPDWILYLDSDELIEYGVTRRQLEALVERSDCDLYRMRLFHFWNSKSHHRFDGRFIPYTLHYQPRLCRNVPEAFFGGAKIHSGFFQGIAPARTRTTSIRVMHFGYIFERQISGKHALYTRIDTSTGRTYDHIVQPDVRLRPFSASMRPGLNAAIRRVVKIRYDIALRWWGAKNRLIPHADEIKHRETGS